MRLWAVSSDFERESHYLLVSKRPQRLYLKSYCIIVYDTLLLTGWTLSAHILSSVDIVFLITNLNETNFSVRELKVYVKRK